MLAVERIIKVHRDFRESGIPLLGDINRVASEACWVHYRPFISSASRAVRPGPHSIALVATGVCLILTGSVVRRVRITEAARLTTREA